jgi:molybdate transport system substrate-binding protein
MRNKIIRLFSILFVGIILIASLTGCSGGAVTSTTTATTTSTTTQITATTTTQTITSTTKIQAITLNISAAASLTEALKEINALYIQEKPCITLTPNFAASGTLQKQIEQGAPADIFISAAASQMNTLSNEALIDNSTRKNLLNNKVVLVVPNDSALGLTSFSDLTLDKVKKIAIGDPKSVPAGTYAQQAFDKLGITAQVTAKFVLGADVKGVLSYVESGNVDAGIVYATDALTSTKVKVVASAPDEINAKVVYPAAVVAPSKNSSAAQDYLNFLFSSQAKTIFEKYGFSLASK